jgi:hypothetical protein
MRVITAEHIIDFNRRICSDYGNEHFILNKSLVESAVGAAFFDMEGVGYVHGEIPEIAAALCFKEDCCKNVNFRSKSIPLVCHAYNF